jgi:hypothetical protein
LKIANSKKKPRTRGHDVSCNMHTTCSAVLVLAAASCVAAFSPSAPPSAPQLWLRVAPAVCRTRHAASPVVMMVRDATAACWLRAAERSHRGIALAGPCLVYVFSQSSERYVPGPPVPVVRGVAFLWRRPVPEASAPVFGRPRRGEERRPRSRCCSMMQSMVSVKRTRW